MKICPTHQNESVEQIVSYKEILSRVHGEELKILAMYLEVPKLPCLINSPLRDDKKPSFRFLKDKEDKIHWIDFSTGEKGNLIDFLMAYLNVDYKTLIQRLNEDTGGDALPRGTKARFERMKKNTTEGVKKFRLAVTHRDWERCDKEYWAQYGISIEALKRANVVPASYVHYVCDDNPAESFYFKSDQLCYAYYEFKDGIPKIKVYQPKSKTKKWMSNLTEDIWSLWTLLPPKGENLFITSSLKDALCLSENFGIPSIAMQGEGYEPKPQIISELKERFRTLWIFFDNDYTNPNNPGEKDAKKLCAKYGINYVIIPSKYQSKDPSDLFKNHGPEVFREAITEALRIANLEL